MGMPSHGGSRHTPSQSLREREREAGWETSEEMEYGSSVISYFPVPSLFGQPRGFGDEMRLSPFATFLEKRRRHTKNMIC